MMVNDIDTYRDNCYPAFIEFEGKAMQFTVGDSPELVKYILSRYTDDVAGQADLEREILGYFWNSLIYRDAVSLNDGAADRLALGSSHNFVYDKRTELVFFDVSGGTHNMLMAYLGALARTDFSKPQTAWFNRHFMDGFDMSSKNADYFIEGGHGLFHSSVGAKKRIMVAEDFDWNADEFNAFRFFSRYHP